MRKSLLPIFIIAASMSFGQSNQTFLKAKEATKDSVKKLMTERHIPGVSVTVMKDGKKVFSQGFGYTDIEQKVPVDPARSKFRIGSISKSLTAAALAKLYEAKKIILDSTIYFYLPDYPLKRYRPTVRQLAGHIAGVRHYKGNEWYSAQHYHSVSSGLSMFKDDSLLYKPGSKYQYTSHGFNLLSAAMEKASGRQFLDLIQEEVIMPLKLTNTVPDLNDSIIAFRTRFYEYNKGAWRNSPYVDNSYKWAGGGFISTSEDIATFGNALLQRDFLRGETIQLFIEPQKLENGSLTNYGMGFFSGKDDKQLAYFGHSGGSVGGTCDMVIYPSEKVVVVILTNLSNASLNGIARHIAHLYVQREN